MSKPQTFEFQTDIKLLLEVMTRLMFRSKDTFLRELIANSSDACSTLLHESKLKPKLTFKVNELAIHIMLDKKNKTLIVKDNGIGMTYTELVKYIGTIPNSGTRQVDKALANNADKPSFKLIGGLGVGFYSVFMVSDYVIVKTCKANSVNPHGVVWVSEGLGEYTVEKVKLLARGTSVILKLKKEAKEFLNYRYLKNSISKYSYFCSFPIYLSEVINLDENCKKDKQQWELVTPSLKIRAKYSWTLTKYKIKTFFTN